MDIRILVFEDDTEIAESIDNCLRDVGYESVVVTNTKKGAEAEIVHKHPDLAILDISAPEDEEAGIKLARMINRIKPIPIIFTSTYVNKYEEILHSTNPFQILEKPYEPHHLIRNINLIAYKFQQSKLEKNGPNDLDYLLKENNRQYKIHIPNITYTRVVDNLMFIHMLDKKIFKYTGNYPKFSSHVSYYDFIRVSRSHMVNKKFVEFVEHDYVCLKVDKELINIPISKSGFNNLNNRFNDLKT